MKTHTNNYKNEIKTLGKQLDSKVTYTVDGTSVELGNSDIISITPRFESNILKSVMKELDIESTVEIPVGTVINYQFGVLVNSSYEYLDFGNYIVKEVEKQEDTNSWFIKCCDKMLYAMKNYEQLSISYPITIREYLNTISTYIGLGFANASDTFVNYDKEIPKELYFDEDNNNLGYTFRDVLDDLAEVTASTIVINDNDELEVRYINQTVGKNLFNINNDTFFNSGVSISVIDDVLTVTTTTTSASATYVTMPIPNSDSLLGKTVTLSANMSTVGGRTRLTLYGVNSSGAPVSNRGSITSNGSTTITLPSTYPTNCVGWALTFNSRYSSVGDMGSTTTYSNVMLEEGNQATPYEPYGDTIDEEYLKDVNVKFGTKYGPVNTVVLSRSAGADKISQSIPSDLPDEQKISVVIADNLIMNDNNRAEYIPAILSQLNGLEYYLNDFSSTGITYYDICDKYNVKVGNTFYKCIMFNDEMLVTQGLQENVHTETPKYEDTDYKKTDKTDQKINQTNLIVDKQGRQITQVISDQSSTNERLNETISTLDGTIQRVSRTETSINDIVTTTQVSTGKNSLYLEGVIEGNALSYSVDGATEQDGTPTPDNPVEVKTIPSIINYFDYKQTPAYLSSNVSTQIIDNGIRVSSSSTGTYKFAVYKVFDVTNMVGKEFTLSLNSNKSGNNSYQVNIIMCDENGGNRTTVKTISNTQNINQTFTIPTISGTSKYLGISLYATGSSSAGSGDYIDYTDIQVEEGSTAHPYIQYGYWNKVKVTGKNIFDVNGLSFSNGYYGANGQKYSGNNNGILEFIEVSPNTTYRLSKNTTTNNVGICEFTSIKGFIKRTQITTDTNDISITTTATTKYLAIQYNYDGSTTVTKELLSTLQLQLEQGELSTTYEPYKENQVLIDMSKENLFDKANVGIFNGYITSTGVINTSGPDKTIYVPCKPNTTYTISKMIQQPTSTNRFRLGTSSEIPIHGTVLSDFINKSNGTTDIFQTITTGNNANYLCAFVYTSSSATTTLDEMLDSIKIYESNNPTPYYELCKIGDYKDTLSIDSSGNVVVNKNVGKVVLNGSESWSSNNGNNASVKITTIDGYKRVEENISYSNYFTSKVNSGYGQVGLYQVCFRYNVNDNVNQLYIGMPTTMTNAEFKTWLSTHNTDVYYVLATPETINLSNTKIPLFEGINHVTFVDDLETNTTITYYRQTPLTGTYATVTQLNEVSTEKTTEIQTVRQEMLVSLSNESLRIDAVNQTIQNGVPVLDTGTGYVFDNEGLKIEKTNQDVKSQLDNDGLSVKYKDEDVLTARSSGVNAINMTVNKFYIQKPIRMEKTKAISDGTSVGLGFFYVGED